MLFKMFISRLLDFQNLKKIVLKTRLIKKLILVMKLIMKLDLLL